MTWPPIQREPCGGWDDPMKVALGGPEQHYNSDENGIPVYTNTTTVTNEICDVPACDPPDPCPSPVAPHARIDCEKASMLDPGDERDCKMATCDPPNPVPPNTYELSETTKDFATCAKRGFKNAYAWKAWHGQIAFDQLEGCCLPTGHCCVEPANLTPPTTRYLRRTMSGTRFIYDQDGRGACNVTYTYSREYLVDRYSGKITMTECTNDADFPEGCGVSEEDTLLPGELLHNPCMGKPTADMQAWLDAAALPPDPDRFGAFEEATWTPTATGWDFHGRSQGADSPPGTPGPTLEEVTMSVRLHDPYTASDLDGDVNTLLAQWDESNDLQQPWRTDEAVTVGPLITRNERGPTSPTMWTPCTVTVDMVEVAWSDTTKPPRPELAEGAIIGAPNPAGYEPYWDFRHPNYYLVGTDVTGELWEVDTWGAAAPSYLPHATQWIDNFLSQMWAPGPFVNYNAINNPIKFTTCLRPIGVQPGFLMKCKWAEVILFAKPTHNFARPCGADKTTRDPGTVDCDSNPTGDLRWPDAPCFCNDPDQTTDCETPADPTNDYEWNDKWRKGEFTIDVWEYDFRAFWESYRTRNQHNAIVNYNTDCAARTIPPETACDPTSCDVPDQLDPYNYIEVAEMSEGFAGETIGSGSYWLKTMTREGHCVAHSVCIASAVYVAPAEPSNVRNGVFKAMPFVGPDDRYGSFWAARVNQWMVDPLWKFPGAGHESVLCDEDCDLLFEDDGSCQGDVEGVCYYPMRDFEESIPAIPAGAPALPSGSGQIGCANYIANANHNPAIDNPAACGSQWEFDLVWFDGVDGCGAGYVKFSIPHDILHPWAILAAQEACVRGSGRFAADYRRNGIS